MLQRISVLVFAVASLIACLSVQVARCEIEIPGDCQRFISPRDVEEIRAILLRRPDIRKPFWGITCGRDCAIAQSGAHGHSGDISNFVYLGRSGGNWHIIKIEEGEVCVVTFGQIPAPEDPIRLRDGATDAGDGFCVHISLSHVAARPANRRKNTICFYVRVPRYVHEAELSDCVIHIEDGHDQLLGTFHSSPHRGDQADKDGVFDVIVARELAKQVRLTIEYSKETELGRTVARQYEMELRDYLPKER